MHAAETRVEDRSIFFYDRKGKVARELEQAGYVVRSRTRNRKGQLAHAEYIIYVHPCLHPEARQSLSGRSIYWKVKRRRNLHRKIPCN